MVILGKFQDISSLGTIEKAIICIQKSIHTNPLTLDSWYYLSLICYIRSVLSKQLNHWKCTEEIIKIFQFFFEKKNEKNAFNQQQLIFLFTILSECNLSISAICG